ncbi:hypothetical protein [Geodermatophilus sp. SYSU D00815]
MPDETPISPDAAGEPAASSDAAAEDTTGTNPESSVVPGAEIAPAGDESGDDATGAPVQSAGRGQRRIIRHTTTTRTERETTTDETVVEDIALAPAVWAAPATEHPRPVG